LALIDFLRHFLGHDPKGSCGDISSELKHQKLFILNSLSENIFLPMSRWYLPACKRSF